MKATVKSTLYRGMALAVLAAMIWSGNFIVARSVYLEIPPVSLNFYRWLLATLVLFPFAFNAARQQWQLIRTHLPYFFWIALTGVSLFNTFVYVGAHYTSAINLALIGTTTSPVFSIILARLLLKEPINWQKMTGLIVCVVGVLFLLAKGSWAHLQNLHLGKGDLWVLIAALCFSVYNTLVKKKPAGLAPVPFLFIVFAFGTLLLIPFFLWEVTTTTAVQWTWQLSGSIIYLGIGASVAAFLIWNRAIAILGAGRTALFGNLIPVFSSLEAVFFLGETFTIYHTISLCLVFAGIVIANWSITPVRSTRN